MCGIVGYIGPKHSADIVIAGLHALEYRGYDSAGIALIDENGGTLLKQVGRVEGLAKLVEESKLASAPLAIGHTRWGTHGQPNIANSHPHTNTAQTIFVVHNGIIENFAELREQLQKEGYVFKSDTDTEVIPHLIDYYYKKGDTFIDAFKQTLGDLRGAYAIAVITTDEPDTLYAARLSSPLVVGVGNDGDFVLASDPTAIMEHTRKVLYLEDYDIAVLYRDSYTILNLKKDEPVERVAEILDFDAEEARLGDFPHFMLKEIYEAPATIRSAILGRVRAEQGIVKLGGLENVQQQFKYIDRIVIAACGTASYAGMLGEYYFEEIAGIPAEVQVASEFIYREEPFSRSTALDRRQPVRRNCRHHQRYQKGRRLRLSAAGRRQCHWLQRRPHDRRRRLLPCRSGAGRRFHQGLHRPGDRPAADRPEYQQWLDQTLQTAPHRAGKPARQGSESPRPG